ncbi:MAG: VTT domain-containing protein [Nitrososphaerota archaeon]|nr:VTT domain-containing protein [Candidatus Calditenuaceae archaeon]MDW8073037.1 VTT domain-containing protein [Nitrososphaerota archaeon]
MPDFAALNEFFRQLEVFALQTGYPGVFLLSLFGSAIPFLPLPYLFVVVILSGILDPLTLGLVSGLGGAIGKITSYSVGRLSYRFLSWERRRKMDALNRLITRYGAVGVFIFALTPLPDDVYYIPIGMTRYSFSRFMVFSAAGKVLLAIIVAYLGKAYLETLEFLLNGGVAGTVVSIAFLAVITAVMLRVDWELFAAYFEKEGIKGVLANLAEILALKRNKAGPRGSSPE